MATDLTVDVVQLTNRDPVFYQLLGPYLANRQVVRELGMPPWDDDDRTWWIALHQGHVAGFAAAVRQKNGRARFGAAWVVPEHRRRGVHRRLLTERLAAHPGTPVTATCTPGSLPNFLAAGFTEVRTRGSFTEVTLDA